MGAFLRVLALGPIVGILSACGAISGLGDYSMGGAADASLVVTKDSSVGHPLDGSRETAADPLDAGDATVPNEFTDAGDDGGDGDVGDGAPADGAGTDADASTNTDSSADASGDAGARDSGATRDAGSDASGCGAINTIQNCGACGRACNQSTGTPSCSASGASCSYTCNSGRADCNSASAPNTDGCECAGNACCGTGCQTAHSNGEGQTYYDCTGTDTDNQSEAQLACQAYTGGTCTQSQSNPCNCLLILCGPPAKSYCGTLGSSCYCWQYSGPNAGTVQGPKGSGCGASCGSMSDTLWH